MDLRLLPAALVAWGSGLAVTLVPGAGWVFAAGCSVGAIVSLVVIVLVARRRPLVTQVAWCLALAALVGCCGAVQWQAARGPVVEAALEQSGPVQVRAVVTGLVPPSAIDAGASGEAGENDEWTGGGLPTGRFEVRATAIDLGEGWAEVAVPLLVFGSVEPVDGSGRAPAIGAEIEAEVKLREPDGGGTTLMAYASAPARQTQGAHPLLAWADDLRERFTVEAAALPGTGGQLLPGLAVGDTRAVDSGLEEAMKASSLQHLTAVSGANCALVVGAIVLVGRLLGWRRGVRVAAAGTALAAFVVLVTPEGSVIRAATMASIVLVVDGWGRHVRGAPVLCLASIVLLVAFPSLAADYGFALSVAATGGLLLGTRPLAARLERWMPSWLAMALAVPIAAQLACQPILILLQPAIPLYGVIANLLAAPAAPIATMVGLVGAILATIAPPLAPVALWIAWVPAQWIGSIATGVASWPLATLPWLDGIGGALLLGALTAAGVVAWLVRPSGRRGRRLSVASGLTVIAVLAVIVGSGVGTALVRTATFPADWRYAACDIGQGDAIVVRGGDGPGAPVALIDTGPEPEPLESCLDLLGIDHIDLLVLSHFDHDHDGAAGAIADRVGAVLVPDTEETRDEGTVTAMIANGTPVHPVAAGDAWRFGDTEWAALWPRPPANGGPSTASGNDGSLTVHVTPRSGPTLLALGDLGEAPQDQVVSASPERLAADVVKMSHHGSRDQSAELYAATGAQLGLVSAGADNGYGHPTSEALGMLSTAGIEAARTDLLGTVVVGGGADAPLTIWSSGRATEAAAPA